MIIICLLVHVERGMRGYSVETGSNTSQQEQQEQDDPVVVAVLIDPAIAVPVGQESLQ
jgi:hypothetical protein